MLKDRKRRRLLGADFVRNRGNYETRRVVVVLCTFFCWMFIGSTALSIAVCYGWLPNPILPQRPCSSHYHKLSIQTIFARDCHHHRQQQKHEKQTKKEHRSSSGAVVRLLATSSSDLKRKRRGIKGDEDISINDDDDDDNENEVESKRKTKSSPSSTQNQKRGRRTTTRSSKNEQQEETITFPKDSVVYRLSKAAGRAHAAAGQRQQKEEAEKSKLKSKVKHETNQEEESSTTTEKTTASDPSLHKSDELASLLDLTQVIDDELLYSRRGQTMASRRAEASSDAANIINEYSNSMSSIVRHNNDEISKQQPPTPKLKELRKQFMLPPTPLTTRRHVAIVLGKPLVDDQVTREYALRIQRLVKEFQVASYQAENSDGADGESAAESHLLSPPPDVICFLGGTSRNNKVSDADAGYFYFRNLCAAQNVSLSSVTDIHLERSSLEEGGLAQIAKYLQKSVLPKWIDSAETTTKTIKIANNSEDNPSSANSQSYLSKSLSKSLLRRTLHVHFSLISSEYHLCQLNDIHKRSPGQSALQALESSWWSVKRRKISVESSWIFLYVSTLSSASSDLTRALADQFYKRTQELVPVLQNLRGVVDNKEFFQRDNYRALVAARRALVRDMEKLYHEQPSLQTLHEVQLKVPSSFVDTNTKDDDNIDERDDGIGKVSSRAYFESKPMDVVLERALLSLGRCSDLVRAAGLLTGSVPANNWKLALDVLEQAIEQIAQACDPDQPLPPDEWGEMMEQR